MPKSKHVGLTLGALALLIQIVTLWINLLHEKEHDKTDYMVPVMMIALFVLTAAVTVWAVMRNLRDANRAESLHSQIQTIKDEAKTYQEYAAHWRQQYTTEDREKTIAQGIAGFLRHENDVLTEKAHSYSAQIGELSKQVFELQRQLKAYEPEE